MHLGNGALTPECCLLTWSAAAAGLGMASYSLRQDKLTVEKALVAGGLSAAVFAAQMFNVQVMPLGVSGHFLGGALLCWALGSSLGAVLMSLILLVQALALGDGGLSAWGANVINMALLPAGLVWLARRMLAEQSSAIVRGLSLAGVSAAAVVGAALLVVLEVAIGRFNLVGEASSFAGAMLANHLAIAAAEAALTVGLVALLTGTEFSVVDASSPLRAAAAIGLALVLVALAIQFGSPLPDGYEAAMASNSLSEALVIQSAGAVATIAESQQAIGAFFARSLPGEFALAILATLVVGMAGTLLTLASLIGRRREEAAAE